MALERLFDIAGSALSAQSVRLSTIASNLANAETVAGSPDEVYRAKAPIFAATLAGSVQPAAGEPRGIAQGVRVVGVYESRRDAEALFQPGHPLADENGNVWHGKVDTIEQLADLISASRSYENNIEVITTTRQILARTLEIGR